MFATLVELNKTKSIQIDVEDILDLTDTEDTSSSSSNIGVYDNRTPLVMDIHEVKKDDPIAENSSPETKVCK